MAASAACAPLPDSDRWDALPQRFAEIERGLGGAIGVCAIDTETGRACAHRGEERFAMASTFKLALAAFVLSTAGELGMTAIAPVRADDILPHSPVTAQFVGAGGASVERLCQAIVEVSDNAAANILLARYRGPEALTAFLRARGDATTRLDRTEPALNENAPGDPRDTTTPAAMAQTMRTLLLEDGAPAFVQTRLLKWLEACETGRDRLRAGLPANWRAGDKTGTGARGAVNDLAIAFPPGRAPLLIAAYMTGSDAPLAAHNSTHAEIARAISGAL